jgi:hypothetical protein
MGHTGADLGAAVVFVDALGIEAQAVVATLGKDAGEANVRHPVRAATSDSTDFRLVKASFNL